MRNLIVAALCSVALASCSLSNEQQAAAAKAYDKICSAEPSLYASYLIIATARGVSENTLAKAAVLHEGMGNMCTERPTDIIAALVPLSLSYAQFIALNAKVAKGS